MKIVVWKTGHEIADNVAKCVFDALHVDEVSSVGLFTTDYYDKERIISESDIHIGYGILRGMDEVFRVCDKNNKPWFNIDKGYWNSGHYDGYYRISLRGTQQTFGLDKFKPDYERWDSLGIKILPYDYRGNVTMICPPTDYVREFFNLHPWCMDDYQGDYHPYFGPHFIRSKDSAIPLQKDLDKCSQVITFNSSVGWEALRQGLQVVSDPTHSIVGAYEKLMDKPLHIDYEQRRRLFSIMAGLQLTLGEIRQGSLWPLLKTLMSSSSVLTPEKQ